MISLDTLRGDESQHVLRHKNGINRICWLVEATVAATFAVSIDELRAPSRGRSDVAFARQAAMYLAHIVFGLNFGVIGALFHRDRTTVAHACQLIENRRDMAAVDRLFDILEGICRDLSCDLSSQLVVRP